MIRLAKYRRYVLISVILFLVVYCVANIIFTSILRSDINNGYPRMDEEVCGNVKLFKNIYRRDKTKWKRDVQVCSRCFKFRKSLLWTPIESLPIYIDNAKFDASEIQKRGTFYQNKWKQLLEMLQEDIELNFIEIGSNVGIFALSAANVGRKVIAVESLRSNIQHLCFSIRENDFENRFIIINNVISNKTGLIVNLKGEEINKGQTFADSKNVKNITESQNVPLGTSYDTTSTIILDDLLDLSEIERFRKVFIKMDTGGSEDKVLLGGSKFFDKIDVHAVLMQWVYHQNADSGKRIINFMGKRNFTPFSGDGLIDIRAFDRRVWGFDILWLQENAS